MNKIKLIAEKEFSKIIQSENNGYYEPLGLYLLQDEDLYIACDNSTGNAWTEEFTNIAHAINFLTFSNGIRKI